MSNKWFSDFGKGLFASLSGSSVAGMAVNAGLGFLANEFSKSQQKEMMREQQKLQMDSWRQQFAMQNSRQNWLMENSASIQKNAMQNAGFSPALMNAGNFQIGAVSNPTGQSISQAPQVNLLDFLRQKAEYDSIVSNTENEKALTKEKILSMQADRAKVQTETHYIPKEFAMKLGMNEKLIEKIDKEMNRMDLDYNLADQQGAIAWEDHLANNAEAHQRIEKMKQEYKFIEAQVLWYPALIQAQINSLYAGAKLSYEQASYYNKQAQELQYRYENMLPNEKEQLELLVGRMRLENGRIAYDNEAYMSVPPAVRGYADAIFNYVEKGVDIVYKGKGIKSMFATESTTETPTTTTEVRTVYDKQGNVQGRTETKKQQSGKRKTKGKR